MQERLQLGCIFPRKQKKLMTFNHLPGDLWRGTSDSDHQMSIVSTELVQIAWEGVNALFFQGAGGAEEPSPLIFNRIAPGIASPPPRPIPRFPRFNPAPATLGSKPPACAWPQRTLVKRHPRVTPIITRNLIISALLGVFILLVADERNPRVAA
jgi:hypothetical protein